MGDPIRAALEAILESADRGNSAIPQRLTDAAWAALAAVPPEPVGVEELTHEELFRIASDCDALYLADDRDYDNYEEVIAAMRLAIAADRARAEVAAAPEVGALTDEKLQDLWKDQMGSPGAILAEPMIAFARAAIAAARTALAAAPPITYEWSITVDDEGVAGGGGPDLQEVERDAAHYLLQFERDGAAVLQIRAVQIIKEITP